MPTEAPELPPDDPEEPEDDQAACDAEAGMVEVAMQGRVKLASEIVAEHSRSSVYAPSGEAIERNPEPEAVRFDQEQMIRAGHQFLRKTFVLWAGQLPDAPDGDFFYPEAP